MILIFRVNRILFLISVVAVLAEARQQSPFFFVQLADPQFGMYPLQKDFRKERQNLSQAIEAANRLHPDFVVICGDLVNRRNNLQQREAFRQTVEKLDKNIPLFLVPGNHDLGNTPTPQSIETYRNNFGPDYYSFNRHGWTFVVLNSTLVKDPSRDRDDEKAQFAWLKSTLDSATAAGSRVVVFQHHPLFVKNAKEPDGYFNVPRKIRKEFLELFVSHEVSHVFAGHLHQNAVGTYKSLTMVTSGPVGMPLGTSPSGLRIVIVRPSGIEHHNYALNKVPHHIDLSEGQQEQTR